MKRRYPPSFLIAAVLLILVMITTSAVVAYMFRKSTEVDNQFDPARVTCEIEEDFKDNIKTSVKVKNTGNITSYIRLRVVTYWVDSKGNVVARNSPANKFGGDWKYDTANWLYDAANQTFYCKTPVAKTVSTPELFAQGFSGIELKKETEMVNNIEYTYHPVVEFIAEAIQSEPFNAADPTNVDCPAAKKWGVTVSLVDDVDKVYQITAVPKTTPQT